jgi:tyrosyl-tRNA synthetase
MRLLQKALAKEVTSTVHSEEEYENAVKASEVLFGKSTAGDLKNLDEATLLDVFDGVPQAEISRAEIESGLDMIAALSAKTDFLKSNGEARRALKENAISVNKEKVGEDYKITTSNLINDKYIIINKGKRNTYIIRVL